MVGRRSLVAMGGVHLAIILAIMLAIMRNGINSNDFALNNQHSLVSSSRTS